MDDKIIKMIEELQTLIEKASDEDINTIEDWIKKIKLDLGGWFIDDFQLYRAS